MRRATYSEKLIEQSGRVASRCRMLADLVVDTSLSNDSPRRGRYGQKSLSEHVNQE